MNILNKKALLVIAATMYASSCMQENPQTVPQPSVKPTMPLGTNEIPMDNETYNQPTPSPTPQPTPSPEVSIEPVPTASATLQMQMKEYITLSKYDTNIGDKSGIISSSNYSDSSVTGWFDDSKNSVISVTSSDISKTAPNLIRSSAIARIPDQISIVGTLANENNTLFVTNSVFEPDITAPDSKNSSVTRIKDNQVVTQKGLQHVLYGLAIDQNGNGFAIVSDEQQINLNAPNSSDSAKTVLGKISVSNWVINDSDTIETILELPEFFQGSNVIRSVSIDVNGDGLLISQGTNSNSLKAHIVTSFSEDSIYNLINQNTSANPQIVLKNDNGHIDWKNGKITLIKNLKNEGDVDFSTSGNSAFLDAAGDGFLVNTNNESVEWQTIKNYVLSGDKKSFQFKEGSSVNSVTVNSFSMPSTLIGMNYTCGDINSCKDKTLSVREVWAKELK